MQHVTGRGSDACLHVQCMEPEDNGQSPSQRRLQKLNLRWAGQKSFRARGSDLEVQEDAEQSEYKRDKLKIRSKNGNPRRMSRGCGLQGAAGFS